MGSKIWFGGLLTLILAGLPVQSRADKPEIQIHGFVDGYYSYNLNNPNQVSGLDAASVSSASIPAPNNSYRYYDAYHNQLTLSLAELSIQAAFKEVSLLADLDFGTFADLNAAAATPSGTVVDESSKHVGQTVVSYKPENSRWSLDAGKMYSHLGIETVKSKDNFNYSRSILFSYGIPFWHTGVRLGYDLVPGKFQSSIYVYNGWNTQYETNDSKTLGVQLKYTPSNKMTFAYNFIGGPGQADTETQWKTVHEINGAVSFSESFALIADAIFGNQDGVLIGSERRAARWYGALLGFRQRLNDSTYFSPRYEIYRDENGYTLGGPSQTIQSAVITYGHRISPGLETRFETRGDCSNANSFSKDSGTTKSQVTFLVAGLFSF